MQNNYVVATIKPWNIKEFQSLKGRLSGKWHLITSKEELSVERLEQLNPRYVFFPHWSWIVPSEILERWECVCFHMADVPYGRGGSPLQNLIVHGHKKTKLSALRMVNELDAGPVYRKVPMSLEGSASDIFHRMAPLTFQLIGDIAKNEPSPQEQEGDVVVFKRRTPKQSLLPKSGDASSLYDHIRMLDAETYPKAFLEWGKVRLTFDEARLDVDNGQLTARVKFESNE
ncbi:methionyl-tRNA formyltransferase [Vibrio aquaticus]|uniref:Methionyl-tRNA formyltransferase n=1 Tax=Vibrio aquaticus TaxID=2496559 RepID=A0A432CWF4_9VIBR|nr:methionyl-tRNA formyltransferase [Vibrio aquaticus]RTZ14657.1 methionyl-tRNA formyltransferase [Vibrio aquaticus]